MQGDRTSRRPHTQRVTDWADCAACREEEAAALFPHKVEISVKKVAQGGSKMQVYFAGDQPILVDEGRGKLFPTGTRHLFHPA